MKNQIESLKTEIEANDKESLRLHRIIAPHENKIQQLFNTNRKLKGEVDRLRIEQQKKKIDWEFVLAADHEDTMEHLRFAETALKSIGLGDNGTYNSTLMQRTVRICLTYGKPETLTNAMKGLKKILPYIKPGEEGWVSLHIFEHTLSERGGYCLEVKGTSCRLTKTTYGRHEILKDFDNLKDAMNYIYKNHYYQKVDADGKRIIPDDEDGERVYKD